MQFQTSSIEQTARLIGEIKLGRPVIIKNNGMACLIFAVESLKESFVSQINNCQNAHLTITARRAETLSATPYDGDLARIILPKPVSFDWLLATANPASDLAYPLKGPFNAIRDGETNISRSAIELCKKAQLLPAAVIIKLNDENYKSLRSMEFLCQEYSEIFNYRDSTALLSEVSTTELPLKHLGNSRIHIFRDKAGLSEHYAIEVGAMSNKDSVLVRLHSACFTGDIVGSLKCDCGSQLKVAIEKISKNGSGILIYLNQEGRGIGLANKMRAYELQNQGFDTVEANHRLGFEDEERDMRIGAQILKLLGYKKIRLLTNNPKKIKCVSEMGLMVSERIDLVTKPTKENTNYLSTKASKSGHLY